MEIELILEKRPALIGIVPFLMEEDPARDTLRVECYEDAKEIALSFLKDYEGRWFTDRALGALQDSMLPYLKALGYTPERQGRLRYDHSYRMPAGAVAEMPPLPDRVTVLLGTGEALTGCTNRTSFDLATLLSRQAPFAAVLTDDRVIAAICTVNDAEAEDEVLELTVQTAPAYRRRGYGQAAVAFLTRELTGRGYTVAYCCSRYNRASRRLAEGLGFSYMGRFYAVAGYREMRN